MIIVAHKHLLLTPNGHTRKELEELSWRRFAGQLVVKSTCLLSALRAQNDDRLIHNRSVWWEPTQTFTTIIPLVSGLWIVMKFLTK
jgi:hypothetical protein